MTLLYTCIWQLLVGVTSLLHSTNSLLLSTDVAANQLLSSGSSSYEVVGNEESLLLPSDTFDLPVSSLRYFIWQQDFAISFKKCYMVGNFREGFTSRFPIHSQN